MYVIFHISCLPYYYCIFLLAEFRGSPFWHLSRRWRYRALSLRLTVLPVAAGLSAWRPFAFSAQPTKYSHTIILRWFPHWNVHGIFVFLFYFAWISSLPYIIIILFPFSHWKQGVVKLTTFSSLLASWFVVRQIAVPPVGLSAWRSFVFRSSITMIFRPDFTVIHTSLECTWYLYIIVFMLW